MKTLSNKELMAINGGVGILKRLGQIISKLFKKTPRHRNPSTYSGVRG